MLAFLAILIPFLIGLAVSVALVVRENRWLEWGLALFLAPAIGIAISSALYFLWLVIFQPVFMLPAYLALEGALFLGIVFAALRRRHYAFSKIEWRIRLHPKRWDLSTWVGVLAGVLLLVAFANFIEEWLLAFFASPDGNWDAWAIWNLHARFLATGAGWRIGFSHEMAWWTHADYPLLLSAFIARVWAFLSNDSLFVPAALDLLFHIGLLGVLMLGVGLVRGRRAAIFAGLFLMPLLFFSVNFQQYADMPLAFYLLSANLFLFLSHHFPKNQSRMLLLAGLMVGAALWTKNEGWAFLAAMIVTEFAAFLLDRESRSGIWKRWMWLGLGCLPILATVLVFKIQVPASNDLVGALNPEVVLQKLSDFSRYTLIWQALVGRFLSLGMNQFAILPGLAFFVLLVGWQKVAKRQNPVYWIGMRVFLTGCVFFVMYLLTPYDLAWHVETSISRLVSQLVPSLILFAFLFAKSLDRPEMEGTPTTEP